MSCKQLDPFRPTPDLTLCRVSQVFGEMVNSLVNSFKNPSECNIPLDLTQSASLDSFIHCVALCDVLRFWKEQKTYTGSWCIKHLSCKERNRRPDITKWSVPEKQESAPLVPHFYLTLEVRCSSYSQTYLIKAPHRSQAGLWLLYSSLHISYYSG